MYNTTLSLNTASDNLNGFSLYDARNNNLTGNTATGNRLNGVNLTGGSNSNNLTGNWITDNGE